MYDVSGLRFCTVKVSEVTRWAAATQPVCRSELKYSTVKPMSADSPTRAALRRHEIVMDVARRSTILGLVGACGNVDGSGVLWKMMLGFLGSSTDSDADQLVSPLSEEAVHVYRAVSSDFKSI
jgi:hypothetical protein